MLAGWREMAKRNCQWLIMYIIYRVMILKSYVIHCIQYLYYSVSEICDSS